MTGIRIHNLLNYLVAAVWVVNGLFCKIFDLVPRHQQMVARILGEAYSWPLTVAIGMAEVGMAVWILSGIRSRTNAIAQIVVVGSMNVLEFFLVPDLLLWGKGNIVFALLFCLIVYFNEFALKKPLVQ